MIIFLCVRYLIPFLNSSLARNNADETLHRLYYEQLDKIQKLSDELIKAREEMSRLASKLEESEHRISRLLDRIKELEAKND